jgi:hypothetical protein
VQGLRHREEIGIIVHPHDTGTIQRRVEYVVGTDQCPGVRYRRPAALGETPCFHHDDGLGAGCGPQRAHEPARIVNSLDVQHDRLRRRVDHEVVEDLAEIDVGGNAAGNDAGKADVARARPVEHCRAHCAGLRNQRNLPRLRHALAECRVEIDGRAHDAEAVRPDEANAMPPGLVEHGLLQRAAVLAGLAETRREDDGRRHIARTAVVEHVRHGLRRRHDDGEFDRLLDIAKRSEALPALHGVVLRIHGIDRSLEAGIHQVLQNDRAERALTLACPDQCHRRSLEYRRDIRSLLSYVLHASFPVIHCGGAPFTSPTGCQRGIVRDNSAAFSPDI